ncbi:MAG: S8 family serine peptidase [Anaerolineae bacterium]
MGQARASQARWRAFARLVLSIAMVLMALSAGAVRAAPSQQGMFASGDRRVIVVLDEAPLLEAVPEALDVSGLRVQDAAASEQLARIEQNHAATRRALEQVLPEAQVAAEYRIALNGLAVRLPEGDVDAVGTLLGLPGVRAVYEEHAFELSTFSSVPAIGANAFWPTVGGSANAGAGVRIAILDDGIAIDHPMFDATGYSYPGGYPRGDTRFSTAKVIVARAYSRPSDPPASGEDTPVPGALGTGHGTHVAGIAAGNPVTTTVGGLPVGLTGVAPRAYLMNYRIFYPSAADGRQVAYTAEILQAIEDAVADGAQVIACGWSSMSPVLPLESAEAVALNAAMDAGVVVVAPAGNAGPTEGSAGRMPGGMERVLTVGSVTKATTVLSDVVNVTAPAPVNANLTNLPFGRALFGPPLADVIGPAPYVELSTDGCTTFPPAVDVAGKIVLIRRGTCAFADKVYNAQQAGAIAVVIINNSDEVTPIVCTGTHCAAGAIIIPAVLVSQTDGGRLAAWRTVYAGAQMEIDPTTQYAATAPNVVQPASGRGPAFARYLKPDVVAPGVAVLSAYHDAAVGVDDYALLSGTSQAMAHAAGAAALLLQAHPGWEHDHVKAALMGSAAADDLWLDEAHTQPATALDVGAGLIDLEMAAADGLQLMPGSLALPFAAPGDSWSITVTTTDPRTSGGERNYTASAYAGSPLTLVVSPTTFTLGPGENTTLEVVVEVATGASAGNAFASVLLTAGDVRAGLPVWAHVTPVPASAGVLLIDNDYDYTLSQSVDYRPYITEALDAAGISYTVWDTHPWVGLEQTLPNLTTLQRYEAVIWFTGNHRHPYGYFAVASPLTPIDMQLLAAYLDGGGRLLATGQNLAAASDVNPDPDARYGLAEFLHAYLGAHRVSESLFDPDAIGLLPPSGVSAIQAVPGGVLHGMQFDLGAVGDGARNQTSVDELGVGGLSDGSDAGLSQAIALAVSAYPTEAGYAGVSKSAEPTLEDAALAFSYRTVYLGFGLEGVNDNPRMTTRAELVRRIVDWLMDAVQAQVPDAFGAPQQLTTLTCTAGSSVGASMASFRWQVGEGASAHLFSSTTPQVQVRLDAGTYPVRVEVTDSLGHKGVAEGVLRVMAGGASMLGADRTAVQAGEQITYRVTLRHGGPGSLAFTARLPLPAGVTYVSSSGGAYSAGALTWSGSLTPNVDVVLEMTVRVDDAVSAGTRIQAAAEFSAGGETWQRSVETPVGDVIYMPVMVSP